jgi:hypothetical protein
MIKKSKLNRKQLAVIHATHGNRNGGLNLFDVKTKKKVHIENPRFVTHINGNRHTVIASGNHPVLHHRVYGIVKHTG